VRKQLSLNEYHHVMIGHEQKLGQGCKWVIQPRLNLMSVDKGGKVAEFCTDVCVLQTLPSYNEVSSWE